MLQLYVSQSLHRFSSLLDHIFVKKIISRKNQVHVLKFWENNEDNTDVSMALLELDKKAFWEVCFVSESVGMDVMNKLILGIDNSDSVSDVLIFLEKEKGTLKRVIRFQFNQKGESNIVVEKYKPDLMLPPACKILVHSK